MAQMTWPNSPGAHDPFSIACGGIGAWTRATSLHRLQASTGRIVRRRINRAGMRSRRSEHSSRMTQRSEPHSGQRISVGSIRSSTTSRCSANGRRTGLRGSDSISGETTTSTVAAGSRFPTTSSRSGSWLSPFRSFSNLKPNSSSLSRSSSS